MILPLGKGDLIIGQTDTTDLPVYHNTKDSGVSDVFYEGGPRPGNVEHQPSGLLWSMDNWIYTTYNASRLRWTPKGPTRGDLTAANALFGEALDIDRKLGRLAGQATRLGNLGALAQRCGDLNTAEMLIRQALEIDLHLGHLAGQARHLENLAIVAKTRGDRGDAEKFIRESLEIKRKLGGAPRSVTMSLGSGVWYRV